MKIIVLDDSKTIRKVMRLCLIKLGIQDEEIVDFENGYDAIKFLNKNEDVRLILTDMEMPSMDGLEFIKITKSYVKNNKIRVVLVSGSKNELKIQTALRHGADKLISKPINADRLIHMLRPTVGKLLEEENKAFQNIQNVSEVLNEGIKEAVMQDNGYLMLLTEENTRLILDVNKAINQSVLKISRS